MAYVLKITPDGLSVRAPDGARELTGVRHVKEAAFVEDGRAIRAVYATGATKDLAFRAFTRLDDLDLAAQVLDSERSIRTTVQSGGRGLHLRVDYSTRKDRKHPVSERELMALAKTYGPAPVWVAEIPELDALAERLGPTWPDRPELGGPRFELNRLDGAWSIQWWPLGGGLESRPSLRDAIALPFSR